MPLPRQYRQQLIDGHEIAEREARRATHADLVRAIRDVACWTGLGLLGVAFALHLRDEAYGRAFWWLGSSIWFGGVSTALLNAYRRGEQRGDW